jgi:hypothetical protein
MPTAPVTAAPAPVPEMLPPNSGPTLAAVAALDAAIAAAYPHFPPLLRDQEANIKGNKQHKHTSLPGVYECVINPLLAQGVVVTSSITLVQGGFAVCTVVKHITTGGWRCSYFPVLNMNSAGSVTAAGTTAPRVGLQLLLGICGMEEEDPPATATGGGWAVAPAGGQVPPVAATAPPVYADPGAYGQQAAQAAPHVQPWEQPAPAGQVPSQWQPPAGAPPSGYTQPAPAPVYQPTQSPI